MAPTPPHFPGEPRATIEGVKLSKKAAAFLLGVAAWNVVTYGNFAKNLAATEGRDTGYYVAHTALIVVNLGIAGVLGRLGWKAWRSAA